MQKDLFYLVPEWQKKLNKVLSSESYKTLESFLQTEYETKKIYPQKCEVFNALNSVLPSDVKVVIIGQDPYHQPNQAHGFCFSVKQGMVLPPSLRNIFKELEYEFNKPARTNGDLSDWSKQGVLLLNSVLTVEDSKPNIHAGKGWEDISKNVVQVLSDNFENIVFMLWGGYAKKFEKLIDSKKHLVITTSHPSPLSANRGGWFNSNCFVNCNNYLVSNKKAPINWFS